MNSHLIRLAVALLWTTLCIGCAGSGEPEQVENTSETDLVPVAGKADTAYYSNFATELQGELRGQIEIDVSDLDSENQQTQLARYEDNNTLIKVMADAQLKLAKSQLNAEKLHLNLSANDMKLDDLVLDGNTIRAQYVVQVETLVTYKELRERNINPSDLVNSTYTAQVVADPRNLFNRFGVNCASGFDGDSLADHNYFYYFDPTLSTCDAPMVTIEFVVNSLLPEVETFPEYDKLTEDGQVDVAIFFGQAENGAVHGGDWGVMMWRTYEVNLRLDDFEKVEGLAVGQRYVRTRNGMSAIVDLFSPFDLEALGEDASSLFEDMLLNNEIVIYNGHSFYGSLNVLDNPSNYPENTYQVLFMNSCWSYEYYTKQVFENKATDADPTGWALTDVINNTTYAWFSRMEQATRIVVKNLLAGAENGGVSPNGRRYTWQNIIGVLNAEMEGRCPEDADPDDCRHYRPREAHEMYGVSGVRTNQFQPGDIAR